MTIARRKKSKAYELFEMPVRLKREYIECLNDALFRSCSLQGFAALVKNDPEPIKECYARAFMEAMKSEVFYLTVREYIDYYTQYYGDKILRERRKLELEGIQMTIFDNLKENEVITPQKPKKAA